jgi:large subunit ribosomal protein L5
MSSRTGEARRGPLVLLRIGMTDQKFSKMENEFYREYRDRVMPAMREQHGYKNDHQIPKLEKVVINTSVGSQSDVKQALEDAKTELALITGQKPAETRAKKSISNFKLRKEQAIGAKVTLRGERMYEFMERLIKAALPRIRDFRGISPKGFDGNGNYTLGVSDQSIFPEVELDKIKRNIGFDFTIVTTARTDEEAKSLLSEMGMPFSDRVKKPVAQAA